jgi:hypothetical protein
VLYPRLQLARGNKTAVAIVCDIEAVKAMCECFLLQICCEFGDQQSVFDAGVSGGECLGHRWSEVQEPKAFGLCCQFAYVEMGSAKNLPTSGLHLSSISKSELAIYRSMISADCA